MEYNLITTKEVGDYRIKIYRDDYPKCPITNWDMLGSFFFEYSDIRQLHDECNWKPLFCDNKHDLRDVIDAIVMEYIKQEDIVDHLKKGRVKGVLLTYDRGNNLWELKDVASPYIYQELSPSDLTYSDCREELIENLDDEELLNIIAEYGKDVMVKRWSTRGYSQGDYTEGIVYVTKDSYEKMYGEKKNWKEDCAKIIDDEVKVISMWIWGDVIGYVLEKKAKFTKKYEDESREDEEAEEWEEVDSCWRYYMEADELIKKVIAEHGLKE